MLEMETDLDPTEDLVTLLEADPETDLVETQGAIQVAGLVMDPVVATEAAVETAAPAAVAVDLQVVEGAAVTGLDPDRPQIFICPYRQPRRSIPSRKSLINLPNGRFLIIIRFQARNSGLNGNGSSSVRLVIINVRTC